MEIFDVVRVSRGKKKEEEKKERERERERSIHDEIEGFVLPVTF